jgi:predicted transcriptional regulator
LTGDYLVEQYIQNNEVLLDTYSQEQIKAMLINTLTSRGLIKKDNLSKTKEVYSLTPFGRNLLEFFVD